MSREDDDAAHFASWVAHKGSGACGNAYGDPVGQDGPKPGPRVRLCMILDSGRPVDVCDAMLIYEDPKRLALLVEVSLAVELKMHALKVGPAKGTVSAGQG